MNSQLKSRNTYLQLGEKVKQNLNKIQKPNNFKRPFLSFLQFDMHRIASEWACVGGVECKLQTKPEMSEQWTDRPENETNKYVLPFK